MIKNIGLLILFFLTVACNSQVFTEEDQQAIESKQEQMEAMKSNLEVISNPSSNKQETCDPKGGFNLLLTLNPDQKILCYDNTTLMKDLSPGPVCQGGVEIKAINPLKAWVPCKELSVCGVKPSQVTPLQNVGVAELFQLHWNNIPWGCTGEISWVLASEAEDQSKINSAPVLSQPPTCPVCEVSSTRTCGVCGEDNTPPEIVDIFVESFVCNEIRIRIFAKDDQGLAPQAYSFDGGNTWQESPLKVYPGLSLSLAANQLQIRDKAGNITQHDVDIEGTAPPCPCDTPWGEKLAHGATHKAFKSMAVNCTTTCEANSQERTCNNGVLSGSNDYKAKTCTVTGCAGCTLPWGDKIEHGDSAKAYNLANAPCKDRCESATLTCDKGQLLGGVETFRYKACAYTLPTCDCTHAGVIIKNGNSQTVFNAKEVECNKTCAQGEVRCTDGTLSGQLGYQELSCSVKPCRCKTAWGGLLDNNQTDYAYKKKVLTCDDQVAGQTCNDANNRIRIRCTDPINNVISLDSGTGNVADFPSETCAPEVCGCVHLGNILKEGDKLKVFKIEEATPPVKCDTEGNFGEVECTKSGNNFRLIGDTDDDVFKYTECKDLEIPGTGTGVGNSPSDVGVGTGGGAGGGTGNSEGDGEGFKRRSRSSGSGCDINSPPYYCLGGTFKMSTPNSWCSLPTEDGYVATDDEEFFSQRIEPGGNLTLYSRKTVTCGDSCFNYQKIVSCDSGVMTNSDVYKYLDCREVCE